MTARLASRWLNFSLHAKSAAGLLQISSCALLCAIVIGSGFPTAARAAGGKKIPVVRLVQVHYLLGPLTLTVCEKGVRLDCTQHMGFVLTAHAPDWTVNVSRADEKAIKSVSLRQFDSIGLMPQLLQTSRQKYISSPAKPYSFKYYGFEAQRVTNIYQTQEYLTLKGLASPEVERIVYSAYRLPTGGGLPVRYIGTRDSRDYFTGKDVRGEKEISLTTSSVKHVEESLDIFEAPKNYHPVSMMQEVVTSTGTRSQAADFQNVFDIASPHKGDDEKKGK